MESLRGIGAMSRASGLTVSALRFYDGAGVLCPARVDPHTGYRSYAPGQLVDARLVATLRRAGMPLAGIRDVLDHRHDPAAVDALLAAHTARLEQGLADARRALSSVRSLLEESPMTTTTAVLDGAALARALSAVRFAVGTDPELPVLGGVLLDVTADAVTAVATDRYRLAVAAAPVAHLDGPEVEVLVPAGFADRVLDLAAGPACGAVTIAVDGAAVAVRSAAGAVDGTVLDERFPDYRRLLPAAAGGVPVDAAQVRAAAAPRRAGRPADAGDRQVVVLGAGEDGGLEVGAADGVAVDREFLLQALDAGGPGQQSLALDGPIAPLVLRSPDSVSLLMPVRLD